MANNYENIISIKFAQAEQPKFNEKKGTEKYVEFGEDNNYPNYLLELFNESPKHGAIVKGKANYIYGKGFESTPKPANVHGESWNQVMKKCILDDELYGGYYLQIIYNLQGQIADVYHLEYYKVRVSKDGSMYYVKSDWSKVGEKIRKYKAFDGKYDPEYPSRMILVKQYNPKSDVYPLPNYFQGLNYIESDIQVSRHILGNAKDGFVASTLINLNGGDPEEEKKEAVEKGIKKKFTGSEGDRIVIMFNKGKENAAEILPLSSTMLTKEDFTNVNQLIQQEIFACHQVTSPMLFGIKTEGQLGGRSEIKDAYEIFNNTYVNERQQAHEETFNTLLNMTGVQGQFKIVPVEPLGFSLEDSLLLKVLPVEWFHDKMGVDDKYKQLPPAEGTAAPQVPAMPGAPGQLANDIIKNLTGRQHQQVMRVVRQFLKGTMTKEQASLMLKSGFAFTDDDVNVFLGVENEKFASQEEIDFALIEQFSQVGESKDDYEILSTKPAREAEYFADVKELSELESNVLNLIKKDKRITSEVIATTLKQDVKVITKIMTGLETAGIVKATPTLMGQDTIIEREFTDIKVKDYKPTTTDILLRYSYDGPKDSKNRPFCAKLMELNKLYSRSDIEQISERLGYSVWDRRGGWFTQPDGEHRPYCRHQWFALTVIRKK